MTGRCHRPTVACLTVFLCTVALYVTVTLVLRYQSSSQDSAASSLTAEKTSHRQDLDPTPERLHRKDKTSTDRRKRLVRQFSLWVHVAYDLLSPNQPWSTWEEASLSGKQQPAEYLKRNQHCVRFWVCYLAQSSGCVSHLVSLSRSYAVTMKMKIISQKHLQQSPPRVQQGQGPAAHWTNRYSRPFTHRCSHTRRHNSKIPSACWLNAS